MNAMMKQVAAARRQGTIRTPNQPTYKRLFVDVTHAQNSSQFLSGLLCCFDRVVINYECDVYLYDKTNPEGIPVVLVWGSKDGYPPIYLL